MTHVCYTHLLANSRRYGGKSISDDGTDASDFRGAEVTHLVASRPRHPSFLDYRIIFSCLLVPGRFAHLPLARVLHVLNPTWNQQDGLSKYASWTSLERSSPASCLLQGQKFERHCPRLENAPPVGRAQHRGIEYVACFDIQNIQHVFMILIIAAWFFPHVRDNPTEMFPRVGQLPLPRQFISSRGDITKGSQSLPMC